MDPVDIQTSIILSRVATGDIDFGRVVERAGAGECALFGGTTLDDAQAAWSSGDAAVTVSLDTGVFGNTSNNKFACAALADATLMAYQDISVQDMSDHAAIGILVKSSIALSAGDLQIGVDETASMGGTPTWMDIPAMAAGKWYYFSIAFGGVATDRDAVLSYGLQNNSGGALTADIHVEYVGLGAKTYGYAGFANDDQAKEGDAAEQYDDVKILAATHALGFLATGETCYAEQPLYPVPGSGKLATTEIVYDGANRPITATEDQSTAAGRVGVRL